MTTANAQIIARSKHFETGTILTTVVAEYPRIVHCFDETTEVLSQMNDEAPEFRKFKAVSELGLKVAQYEGGKITFVDPIETVEQSGVFDMVKFNKKKFPLFSTDGHRVLTTKRTTNNIFKPNVIEAKNLLGDYGCIRIPQSGLMNSSDKFSPYEYELLAWFVADGHCPNGSNIANFHFKKARKVSEVERILRGLGIEYKVCVYNDEYVIRFEAPIWVKDCYDNGIKKYPDYMLSMSQETYLKFKQALFNSDGNVKNSDYNTTSKVVAEQIQVLAHTHGDSVNVHGSYGNMFKLIFKDSDYISLRQDKDEFDACQYHGTVYCVTVPSSFIMVKRNGVVFITGNCEFMTHRMLSKNASSSRAIPADTVIQQLEEKPFIPQYWGMNQSGMQAKQQLEGESLELAKQVWEMAGKNIIETTRILKTLKVHKQLANRASEWLQNIRVCVSGTEWNNFHWLRNHGDAQPEIQDLAVAIESAVNIWDSQGKTNTLNLGEWHLPFYMNGVWKPKAGGIDEHGFSLDEARMISVSCAAQTSYRKNDDSLEKAKKLFDMFFNTTHIHASPSEHAATVMALTNYFKQNQQITTSGFETMFEGMNEGATHVDKNGDIWSGNFKHFVQFRQLIPNHVKAG